MRKKKRYGGLEIEILSYFNDEIIRLLDLSFSYDPHQVWLHYSHAKKNRKKKKKRYKRDEALYNLIHENKPLIFFTYLPSAVRYVLKDHKQVSSVGKPPKEMYDKLTCLVIIRKLHRDLRESIGWLRLLKFVGLINVSIPCFKSLSNYMNDPLTLHYLDKLIQITSDPLKMIETDFATDSYGRHVNFKNTKKILFYKKRNKCKR